MTTVHYIEKYLKDGDKILDIGAGAGEYSLYFARKGYGVSALELADANIAEWPSGNGSWDFSRTRLVFATRGGIYSLRSTAP